MQKTRNANAAVEAAKKYVNQQLQTMKQYGSAPKLTKADIEALIQQVAKVTRVA